MDEYLQNFLIWLAVAAVATIATIALAVKRLREGVIRRIAKWAGVSVLALASLISLGITHTQYSNYKDSIPTIATELDGFKLGWSERDVLFYKGAPNCHEPETSSKCISSPRDLASGQYGGAYHYRKAPYGEHETVVFFDKVFGVSAVMSACQGLILDKLRAYCGKTLPLRQFKDFKVQIEESEDGLSRLYGYPELQTGFIAREGKVDVVFIYSREIHESGPVQFKKLSAK